MTGVNINIVTALIFLSVMYSVIKGITNKFYGQDMYASISGMINNIIYIVSLAFSIYVVRSMFMGSSTGICRAAFNMLPERVVSYLKDSGILVYIILVPLFLLILLPPLAFLKSRGEDALDRFANYICSQIRKLNRAAIACIGVLFEIPRLLVKVFVIVLFLSLLSTYYPANLLSAQASESRAYNYLYSNAVYPIMESQYGRKVPEYLWQSIQEISKGIGDSKVLNKSDKLQTLGLIRFQYETKSDSRIDSMARQIVGNEKDEKRKAYLLYKWIGHNISYDWEKYDDIVNGNTSKDKFGAIPAFDTRKGVCEDYSDLYVAMARAVGLKVRIIVGQGRILNGWGGHAWNEVYIDKENRWLPLDTTWASSGNNFDTSTFYINHVSEAVAGEWQ